MYVLVVTLSFEEDNELLNKLKTGFKRTIKWNKCMSQMSNQTANNNLNYLIDPTFSNVNVLSFENEEDRTSFSKYYAPKVEIKDYNVIIDGKPFFEISVKNKEQTYEKIIEISKNSDYTAGNLLDYEYFKDHYKLIAIDLSKQSELENNDISQQINFIGRLEQNATMFFIIEKKRRNYPRFFTKFCNYCIKMESQKIINLLNNKDIESQKFTTKKWYIVNDQNNGQYGEGNENDSNIKFETKVIKPNLCDYSNAYILVNGNIENKADNPSVCFKNCAPFTKCITHINDEHLETTENLDIIMRMYQLLEYSDNYSDSSGSLYQFKRDEPHPNNGNVSVDTSSSFKYKSNLLGNEDNNVKIVVPLKYLSNFFRSLEMPLINCKIHLELNWTKDCVLSSAHNNPKISFKITETKLYVPIVTLSTKDNVNLTKQLNEGFKRSLYWNEYKSKIEKKNLMIIMSQDFL